MSDDLPTFPTLSECAALWPLWILLLAATALWLFAELMGRRTRHWHRLKRDAEIAFAESERQRRLLQ